VVEHFLPVGKHQRKPLSEVPVDYLRWYLDTCRVSSGLRAAIKQELVRRGADPASLPADPPRRLVACQRCGSREVRVSWQERRGDALLRGDCARCGHFVGWQPLTDENVAAADRTKGRTGLLDVLTRADAEAVSLLNWRGQEIIPVPAGKASPALLSLVRQNNRLLLAMLPRHAGY
jgi:hypothetical protein